MPAYFTCPICGQKNHGKVQSPQGLNALIIEECERCGAEKIYWVANEHVASLLRKQKDPPKNIAVGVGESSIEFMDPQTAVGRNKRIRDDLQAATLEAPYSQGKRTKAFTPDNTAIAEGLCEGQCLHWIRRVLQGGKETYQVSKPDDADIILKQRKQHKSGVTIHGILQARSPTAMQNMISERITKTFLSLLTKWGCTQNQKGEWVPPLGKQDEFNGALKTYEDFMEKVTSSGQYAHGWENLAKTFDHLLRDELRKSSKRPFSNIIVIKSGARLRLEGPADFVNKIKADLDFRPGTCALLSLGLRSGLGEAGGAIPGHAIAAHFKEMQQIFLFDPNLGIFKTTSLEAFHSTLETLITTVWTERLKWKLDNEFGYALFRRGDTRTAGNTVKRDLEFSENPEFTAANAKANRFIPGKMDHQ